MKALMNFRRNPNKGTVCNKVFRRVVVLSLALHSPLILQERPKEVWEERENIVYVAQEATKAVLNRHPVEKSEYVSELEETLSQGRHIDLGDFYLRTQYLEGRLDEAGLRAALDKLADEEDIVRGKQNGHSIPDVLEEIKKRRGSYSLRNSYLSTLLLEGCGNCSARQRFTASLINRIYPDAEMTFLVLKLDNVMHVVTLVRGEGGWINADNPKGPPLIDADLNGFVLYQKYDDVRSYIGQDHLGEYWGSPDDVDSYTRFKVSDDFMWNSFPDGIGWSDIRSVTGNSNALYAMGLGLGAVGTSAQTNSGSSASPLPFPLAERSVNIIYDPEFASRNRERAKKLLDDLNEFRYLSDSERKTNVRQWLPSIPESCLDDLMSVFVSVAELVTDRCQIGRFGTVVCPTTDGADSDTLFRKKIEPKFDRLNSNPACEAYDEGKGNEEFDRLAEHLEKTYGLHFEEEEGG